MNVILYSYDKQCKMNIYTYHITWNFCKKFYFFSNSFFISHDKINQNMPSKYLQLVNMIKFNLIDKFEIDEITFLSSSSLYTAFSYSSLVVIFHTKKLQICQKNLDSFPQLISLAILTTTIIMSNYKIKLNNSYKGKKRL